MDLLKKWFVVILLRVLFLLSFWWLWLICSYRGCSWFNAISLSLLSSSVFQFLVLCVKLHSSMYQSLSLAMFQWKLINANIPLPKKSKAKPLTLGEKVLCLAIQVNLGWVLSRQSTMALNDVNAIFTLLGSYIRVEFFFSNIMLWFDMLIRSHGLSKSCLPPLFLKPAASSGG